MVPPRIIESAVDCEGSHLLGGVDTWLAALEQGALVWVGVKHFLYCLCSNPTCNARRSSGLADGDLWRPDFVSPLSINFSVRLGI